MPPCPDSSAGQVIQTVRIASGDGQGAQTTQEEGGRQGEEEGEEGERKGRKEEAGFEEPNTERHGLRKENFLDPQFTAGIFWVLLAMATPFYKAPILVFF